MTSIPKNAPLVYVSFSAEINANTAENLIAVMANCANEQVKEVCVLLSTPGGSVRDGCNLYNVLRGMPFELITHNTGTVASVGNAVFLAGNRRYATRHSTFMFHGVGHTMQQQQRLEQKDFEERLGALMSEQKVIGGIISERTKILENEIAELFRQGQTKDAEFAIEKGIIDEIREVRIERGCPMVSLVFKR
jgi:ATP-dependent protease ClpP protease subunit